MELSGYLSVARRWWWTLLVATWIASLSGYLVASRITPTYEAVAQVLVGPINTDIDTIRAASQLSQTYAELAISQQLLESTSKELGGAVTIRDLTKNVRATADDVKRIVTIRADDSNPDQAALIANTVTTELGQLTTAATTQAEGKIQVISPAVAPTAPIAPQVSLIVLLAAMAGLLGALVLVILIEYLSDTVKDRSELSRLTDAPLLGLVDLPVGAWPPGSPPVVEAMPGSPAGVMFRQLTTKLIAAEHPDVQRRILVVAIGESESAVVAANVATSAGFSGHRVTLVDGAPSGNLSRHFGISDRPGLGDVLADAATDAEPMLLSRSGELRVLPRGRAGNVERLNVDQARLVLHALGTSSEIVVIDGGSIESSAAALAWAQVASASTFVVTLGETKREAVRVADESLRLVGASGLGAVLVRRARVRRLRPTRAPEAAITPQPGNGRPDTSRPMAKRVVPGQPMLPPTARLSISTVAPRPADGERQDVDGPVPPARVTPGDTPRQPSASTRSRSSHHGSGSGSSS